MSQAFHIIFSENVLHKEKTLTFGQEKQQQQNLWYKFGPSHSPPPTICRQTFYTTSIYYLLVFLNIGVGVCKI